MTDLIWLRTDQLSAAIDPLGAELTHLRDADGAELMTDCRSRFPGRSTRRSCSRSSA